MIFLIKLYNIISPPLESVMINSDSNSTGKFTNDMISWVGGTGKLEKKLPPALRPKWSQRGSNRRRVKFFPGTPEGSHKIFDTKPEGLFKTEYRDKWLEMKGLLRTSPQKEHLDLLSRFPSPRSTCAPHPDQTSNGKVSVKVILLIRQSEI